MNIKYHKEIKLYFEIKIESFHENTDNNVNIIIIRNTKFICYYLVRTREGDILIHSNAYERFSSYFYELKFVI